MAKPKVTVVVTCEDFNDKPSRKSKSKSDNEKVTYYLAPDTIDKVHELDFHAKQRREKTSYSQIISEAVNVYYDQQTIF